MTRPPAREVVAVRMRPDSRAKVAELATKRGESVSATARALIAYGLAKMPEGWGK